MTKSVRGLGLASRGIREATTHFRRKKLHDDQRRHIRRSVSSNQDQRRESCRTKQIGISNLTIAVGTDRSTWAENLASIRFIMNFVVITVPDSRLLILILDMNSVSPLTQLTTYGSIIESDNFVSNFTLHLN
ncbi:hypothetical protein EVAR_52288_1 [Eumeta japonica]|uniref:Uncharacterized protein n=1 Tax=Eumeta variegata TaxID=151549 RepID=A0A4C1ZPW4_EUMVA|nr:hypothetical protein EVAR_52288_1 [Eumeta japonica]